VEEFNGYCEGSGEGKEVVEPWRSGEEGRQREEKEEAGTPILGYRLHVWSQQTSFGVYLGKTE